MSSEPPPKRRPSGLGRGLSSLLGEVAQEASLSGAERSGVQLLPVASIDPFPGQPRRHFDDAALDELAASISARGVLQPILVRSIGGRYQIVAGERRWRAAQRAHIHEVPVIIRDFNDIETFEISLLENIQRQDLNAIEEAEAYRRLIGEFGHTQEALGRLVHKSRSHIANLMRLLDLPERVRNMVASGHLSMGHARAIATALDPESLAEEVLRRGLSVRQTERLARGAKPGRERRRSLVETNANADLAALERQLGDMLGLRVKITYTGGGGSVALAYSTLDQLDMICQRLSGERI
jgi:ParB family transcriptional regulator, chromosome partitioning protein